MIFLFGLVEIKWFLRVEKSLGYVTLLKKTWPLSVCANPIQNKKTEFVKCIALLSTHEDNNKNAS